jgi:anthranilate synthase component 2
MRYHSLMVERESLPESLEITAYTNDATKEVMGLRHKQYPIEGIQFHPESFATQEGNVMFKNFLFQ